jgi:hypothetical protein
MERDPSSGGRASRAKGNGRRRTVRVQENGELSEPVQVGAENSQGRLSPPVELDSAPPQIASPETGKPIPMATVRFLIALLSIAILAFVVVASFVTIWQGQNIDNLTRLLEIIFAPLIALVAAAVAFYYRSSNLP